MSEPTIRLATCRSDGRCPECGDIPRPRDPVLPCGCKVDAEACIHGHWGALLTESIRQRDEARAEAEALRGEREDWLAEDALMHATEQRADRAESLLRVVLDSAPISTVSPLLTAIREALQ